MSVKGMSAAEITDRLNQSAMTRRAIDSDQQTAARVAGLAFPISFAIVVAVNFGVFARLITGDPAETARNVLAHATLFRIGIVGDVVYCVGAIVLLSALYVVLEPVSRILALLAAIGRLVQGLTWLLVAVNLFTALRLLTNPIYSRAFGPDQLPALARLYLGGYDAYYVGLLFWASGTAIGSYLWLKSNYIPWGLAAFGMISSAWCAACTLTYYVIPDFATVVNLSLFDVPMVIFELTLSIWLLFKGLRSPRVE